MLFARSLWPGSVSVAWLLALAAVLTLLVPSRPAWAQSASVKDPWVRTTVPRQKSSSVYMDITALRAARLIEASSPVAGVVEIHEMSMENNVMRMRAIPALDLPSGVTVSLRPGGLHVMLMDLRTHIREGDMIPLSLVIELRDGRRETLEIRALARAPRAGSASNPHGGYGDSTSSGAGHSSHGSAGGGSHAGHGAAAGSGGHSGHSGHGASGR